MKTQGEIESAICEGISRFERDYMGRGPKDIRTHLLETARPVMETMVEEVTGIKVLSLHHDISRPSGRINANSVTGLIVKPSMRLTARVRPKTTGTATATISPSRQPSASIS